MPGLIILILLTIFLYIQLKKALDKGFVKIKDQCAGIKNEYDRLFRENAKLKEDNLNLENTAEETIALYNITKEICRSLDTDTVFINFYNQINKYIDLKDCRFLKGEIDLSPYKGYTVLPLQIDARPIGYLVAEGVSQPDKERFHILCQQFMLGIKRAHLYHKVQELAITDSLTQVFSRRYCLERLSEELGRSKKFKYNFSFLMVDIDHFKDYNDRYGHLVGDTILREVSGIIKESIRQIDLIGRYGGEEFAIILTESDKEQAKFAAERIRQAVENKNIRAYDEDLKVTVSIGISTFPGDGRDRDALTLIDRADRALYRAKQAGRNRCCV